MQYSKEYRYLKKFTRYAFYFCTTLLIQSVAHADNNPNEQFGYFTHKDWEIACDNTLTCRAVGYSQEDQNNPVAILIERSAGNGALPQIYLNVAEEASSSAPTFLLIDGQNMGQLYYNPQKPYRIFSLGHNTLLFEALEDSKTIQFQQEGKEGTFFELSSAGSNAVLLKMDEIQGRLDTPSALIRKGNKPDSTVYPPRPKPQYTIPQLPSLTKEERQADRQWVKNNTAKLNQLITEALAAQSESDNPYLSECEFSEQDESEQNKITSQRLDESTIALEQPCWTAAYNSGSVLWTIDQKTMQVKQIVTTASSGHWTDEEDNVDLSMAIVSHKGRGIGDCWSVENYIFTGEKYVPSFIMNNQLCRGFAGGAFELPTFVSDVVDLND